MCIVKLISYFTCPLFIFSAFVVNASDKKDAQAYMQYDVKHLEQPIGLDCMAKHARYLPAISQRGDKEFQLARIDAGGREHEVRGRTATAKRGYATSSKSYVIPDVSLITAEGTSRHVKELLDMDKPVMLNFIFTTCTTICPVLSSTFTQVQKALGEENDKISMISITIDPEFDTADKLMEYSQRFNAGSQWAFFTGKLDDVTAVEKAFDIYHGSKTNHEPATFIRAGKDKRWLRIDGLASASDLIAEYRKLLAGGN